MDARDAGRAPAALVADLCTFEGSLDAYLARLLALQCAVGPCAAAGLFRATPDHVELLARVPADMPARAGWLERAAELGALALREQSSIEAQIDGPAGPAAIVAVPMTAAGDALVGAYLLPSGDAAAVQATRERLELTTSLIALQTARRDADQQRARLAQVAIATEVAATVVARADAHGAAVSLVNELAGRMQLERVAIGFEDQDAIRVVAVSHTERVQRGAQIILALEAAMEECLEQDIEVRSPAPPDVPIVARLAAEFVRGHGGGAIASVPLRVDGRAVGVLTVERDTPIGDGDLAILRLLAELVTARLEQLRLAAAPARTKALRTVRRCAAGLVGTTRTLEKLLVLLLLACIALVTLVPVDRRATAPATVEAEVRRVVSAPFTEVLEEAAVTPDQDVIAGETVLARLRTTDLQLELAAATFEREAASTDAIASRADGRYGDAKIAEARASAAAARVALLERRIAEAVIVAPIDGTIVAGELDRVIGSRVERGQVLAEIAGGAQPIVRIAMPESRVGEIEAGMQAVLVLAARPGEDVPCVIERIDPVARVREGENVFEIEARLSEAPAWLRPGMEGVVRATTGRTTLAGRWLRPVQDWLRLRFWW